METFLASLFSASVLGVAVSSYLLGLVKGSWLGWRAKDREAREDIKSERRAALIAGRVQGERAALKATMADLHREYVRGRIDGRRAEIARQQRLSQRRDYQRIGLVPVVGKN